MMRSSLLNCRATVNHPGSAVSSGHSRTTAPQANPTVQGRAAWTLTPIAVQHNMSNHPLRRRIWPPPCRPLVLAQQHRGPVPTVLTA